MIRMDSGKPIVIEFKPYVRLRDFVHKSVLRIRLGGDDSIDAKFVESYVLGGQLMMLKPGCVVQIGGNAFKVSFEGKAETVNTRNILQIREKGGTIRWP